MEPDLCADFNLPSWLPGAVRLYLGHTGVGISLRELARREGLAASTVMRQIRRYEARRDDPLVDEALDALVKAQGAGSLSAQQSRRKDDPTMTAPLRPMPITLDETEIQREGRRVLRRLAEPGAVLAIAPNMERAAVLRDAADGRMVQTAVLDRAVAQAFALKEWIAVRQAQGQPPAGRQSPGRLTTYEISTAGRAELKRLIEAEDHRRMTRHAAFGLAEVAAVPGLAGTQAWGSTEPEAAPKTRFNMAESPVAVLARRRDRDGKAFLGAELVQAAERLREDFELAQLGSRGAQNWDRFLSEATRAATPSNALRSEGPAIAARDRVAAALRDLGPGLGDVALRVCCYLEGLEIAERRMGWAARSGKIVLRIALQRLRRHYDEAYGRAGPLIG